MCLDEQGEENGDGVDVRSNVQLAVLRIKLRRCACVSVPELCVFVAEAVSRRRDVVGC